MKNIAFLVVVAAALSACGTVEGLGNDIAATSRGIQNLF